MHWNGYYTLADLGDSLAIHKIKKVHYYKGCLGWREIERLMEIDKECLGWREIKELIEIDKKCLGWREVRRLMKIDKECLGWR